MSKKDYGFNLTLLAQVLANSFGVKVVIRPGATTFSTNGTEIYVPDGLFGAEIDADIIRGGLAHEAAGHCLHTDFKALTKWKHLGNALAKSLANVIEDPRIERCAIRKFPGARKILENMVGSLDQKGFFALPPEDAHASSVLISWLIRALRADPEVMGQPISADVIQDRAEEVFGKDGLKEVYKAAKAGALSGSTKEVLKSVEKILDILGDMANPPEEQQPQQPQQPQQGEGQGQPQPGQGQNPSGAGQPDPAAEAKAAAQAAAAQEALDAQSTKDTGKSDLSDIVGEAMDGMAGGNGRGRTQTQTAVHDRRTPKAYNASGLSTKLTMQLRSRLAEHLRSRVEDEDDQVTDQGRLDGSRLVNAMMGDRNVFVQHGEEAEGLSAAVHVLVDCSGSMQGEKANAAGSILYAMASAIAPYEQQGIRFAVSAFNGNVHELKRFGDPWVRAKHWAGNYEANGGTMMPEAIATTLPGLCGMRESRKTLFIITDGDVGDQITSLRNAASAKRMGVDLDVLCIGGHCPQDYGFRSSESVGEYDPAGIQKAIFKVLKKAI